MADTVAAVAELIETQAHERRAHLVGLSLGGYVALDLAASRPDLVPSAIASGVNVLPFPHPRLMGLAGRLMSPFMTLGPLLRANARSLGVKPEDFQGYAEAARMMAPGTFLRVGAELMDYRIPSSSGASASRILAIAGQKEQELIVRSVSEIAAAFPRGSGRLAAGVGHAWNGESPDLFAQVVRDHISEQPLPRELLAPTPG
jgi:pimeloyl-ACP methyl ester carboxylesterase